MKKCPTCDKTFEDSLRFCQVDGTPLVDDAPFDPYATIVSSSVPPAPIVESESEAPVIETVAQAAPEPVAAAIAEPEEILDLPSEDPLKTVYVTDAEMRNALAEETPIVEEPADETPAVEEPAAVEDYTAPEPPSFSVPDVPAPSFSDAAIPPSPFAVSDAPAEEPAPPPPVFDDPVPAPPSFDEAATIIQPTPAFEPPPAPVAEWAPPPAPVAEWSPPPAPVASWENQDIGSNTPFQPPPAGTGSVNQTLAIISLVLGIISLCCYISPVTGLAALITGFMAMKKVNEDPANFGGNGLAIAGMITGGIFFLIGIVYWIIIIFFGGLSLLMGR